MRSARAAHWARAATSAQERSARSGKQGPRQCLEVWSCLPLRRMAESSAGDFTAGKIQKTRRQRVAKMYGQQKRNMIHTSSTAYEQDHSAAAHNPRARRPGGGSCCNLMDCRPTQSRMVGDHYEVKVDGAWTPVPYDQSTERNRAEAVAAAQCRLCSTGPFQLTQSLFANVETG